MSPFKFIITIVILVMFTASFQMLRGVLAGAVNAVWLAVYGRAFTWSDVPQPWQTTLQLLNMIADNIFPIGVLLTLVIALIESFQWTREGVRIK